MWKSLMEVLLPRREAAGVMSWQINRSAHLGVCLSAPGYQICFQLPEFSELRFTLCLDHSSDQSVLLPLGKAKLLGKVFGICVQFVLFEKYLHSWLL